MAPRHILHVHCEIQSPYGTYVTDTVHECVSGRISQFVTVKKSHLRTVDEATERANLIEGRVHGPVRSSAREADTGTSGRVDRRLLQRDANFVASPIAA
ncbi:hypothetical protein JOB18_011874 [Solea senegalensis]|uniref:Uncharacterized protein n=1 Tax=Solea senegalensis TaxID=28829 RepID=A0AAV6RBK2_SOLSE|nr:hypothetical protein JOB18_011874 [Solea senegalensis]